jgi:hypothetical protein
MQNSVGMINPNIHTTHFRLRLHVRRARRAHMHTDHRYARMHRCPCVSAPRTADTGTALRGARGARGGLVHCTV